MFIVDVKQQYNNNNSWHNRDMFFSIFFDMKVCCVFSLESPLRGNSNAYTQYTIFNIKMKIALNYSKSAVMGYFSKDLKNEFETAVVNEPSVFEPLKCGFVAIDIVLQKTCPW